MPSSPGDPPRTSLPVGVERVVARAATDPTFREDLHRRQSLAAVEAGLALTASERAILDAIEPAQLDAMAQALPPALVPAPRTETFLPTAGIRPEPVRGSRPALPIAIATAVVVSGGFCVATTAGVRPDLPPPPPTEVLDAGPTPTDAGAMPPDQPAK